MRLHRRAGVVFAALAAALAGVARGQVCEVTNNLLVDQVNLARAQLGKYSEQLATWARIEADTSPDQTARQSLSIQVNSDFAASLNDPDGDGYLTPGELAADDQSAALVEQLRAVLCEQLALDDCSRVVIEGIGTGTTSGVQANVDLDITDEYNMAVMAGDANGDGILTQDEIDASPVAAQLVRNIQIALCAQLGDSCTDPDTIDITAISSSAGGSGRRRSLRQALSDQVSLMMAPSQVQAFGNGAALTDCGLSEGEIYANPKAASFAVAFGRNRGAALTGLRVPGCAHSAAGLAQSLDSQRRVTVGAEHWARMGGGDAPMTAAGIAAHPEATEMASDFHKAGCTEFGLAQDVCERVQVQELTPVVDTEAGTVTLSASLGLGNGQLLVLAETE